MFPPAVPRPTSTRGRWLARQRADQARGLFLERTLVFDFGQITPLQTVQLIQPVTSMGGRFVRCTAIRGSNGANPPGQAAGLQMANLQLRVQLHGDQDLFGGNGTNTVSLASLFDDVATPWFWFLSPPLFRTGDTLTLTLENTFPSNEVGPDMTAQVALRIIDDDLWQELYSRDWSAEQER